MLYYVYATLDGEPKTGLTAAWEYLVTAENGTDKSGSGPAISELAGGWYKFAVVFGTAPWDVLTEDLVGVIDIDSDAAGGLSGSERYIPITITLRGMALARLAHKGIQTKSTGDVVIYATDGSTGDMKLDMTNAASTITRAPAAPA